MNNALPLVIGIVAAAGAYLVTMGIIASRATDATALARERLARQEVGLGQVVWLDQLVRDRRAELESSLPNALDVVAISMEAGLGLDRALEQLVRHQDDSLTLLVARALREIQLGRPRADALEEMAEATGVEDFASLVRGILYAERTGVPIARTIAAHAAQMRVRRRLKIRTEAARASLKILLPTVGCVFPTLWLILLGPALIVVLTLGR